jgi:hypothetical protein
MDALSHLLHLNILLSTLFSNFTVLGKPYPTTRHVSNLQPEHTTVATEKSNLIHVQEGSLLATKLFRPLKQFVEWNKRGSSYCD